MVTKDELKDFPVFNGLSDRELEIVASLMERGEYATDEVIFGEGSLCKGMFFIQRGSVQMRKTMASGHSVLIKVLKEGEVVESFSWGNWEVNHYSAVAIKPVGTILLSAYYIDYLKRKYPAYLYKIMKNFSCSMASRLNQSQTDLVDMTKYLEGESYT